MNQPSDPQSIDNRFALAGIRRGMVVGQALAIGTFIYGMAFGLLSREVGLSVIEAALMSATIYSASAQLAALTVLRDFSPWTDASIWLVATTIFIVNARYLMYGATLQPWLKVASPLQSYSTLFILGDANWVASTQAHESGENDAGYIFGSGLVMFVSWVSGSLIGSMVGTLIANPEMLGLDFLIVSFAAASAIMMFQGRRDVIIVVVASITAFITSNFAHGGWPIIAAGIAGATTAFIRQKREDMKT